MNKHVYKYSQLPISQTRKGKDSDVARCPTYPRLLIATIQ